MPKIRAFLLDGGPGERTQGAVDALLKLTGKPKGPALGIKVRRGLREVQQALQDVEAQRQELLDRFAKKNKDDSRVVERLEGSDKEVVKLKDPDGFAAAYQELLNTEVEVGTFFTPEDFAGQPSAFVVEDELALLGPLFVDEADAAKPSRARPAKTGASQPRKRRQART